MFSTKVPTRRLASMKKLELSLAEWRKQFK
jgi:hypothetical protein